jgi:endonuclease/exonuclease/phosphatase family metal-dependent hydrolase
MVLRLGTFNVWGLPEAFGFGDDVSSRMRLIVERLSASDLDVLMIQEAWTSEVRDTLREGGRAAGFEVVRSPDGHGGLMTLSRRPIRETRFERFHFRGDPERLAGGEFLGGKGFLETRIEGDHGDVSIVNTHLHARYRRSRPRLNSAVRLAQLIQVVGHLFETQGSVVVGGDFNCSVGELEYEIFRRLSGASELGGGSRHPTLSRTNYYKRHRTAEDKRIDFLFVRPAPGDQWRASDARLLFAESARIRAIDRSLSDHFGFRAALTLEPARWVGSQSREASADAEVLALAYDLLDLGNREAEQRADGHRQHAWGYGLASAACLLLGEQVPVDRRAFLRRSAKAVGCGLFAPTVGYGVLAHFDGEGKRDAFADARAILARLEARAAAPSA